MVADKSIVYAGIVTDDVAYYSGEYSGPATCFIDKIDKIVYTSLFSSPSGTKLN